MGESAVRFVLRFFEDEVEYGEGVLPAFTQSGELREVVPFSEVEAFVKSHRDGFPDDYTILADSANIANTEDLKRLVSHAVEKGEQDIILRVVSAKSDWEMVDNASQWSKASASGINESTAAKQIEAEAVNMPGQKEDLNDGDTSQPGVDFEVTTGQEVEIDGEEAAGQTVVAEAQVVDELQEAAESPLESTKDVVEAEIEVNEEHEAEEPDMAVEDEKDAEAVGTNISTNGVEDNEGMVDDAEQSRSAENEGVKDSTEAKMASGGFFEDSDPSLNLDMLDECWSRSTFAMSRHCLPKPTLSNHSESPSFLNVRGASVDVGEPVELQELISLLRGVVEELIKSDPLEASSKLSDFLSGSTLHTTIAQLAADEGVVESIQAALGSSSLKNLVVDLGRNEVDNWSKLKEIINTHLGDLFAVFGDVLKQSPQLVSVIPYCLKLLTGFLEANKDEIVEEEEAEDSNSNSNSTKEIHPGILCDGCDDPERKEIATSKGVNVNGYIKGIRYKSAIKVNFDLCESCEASGDWDEEYGPFLKIKTPKKAPKEILCVLNQSQSESPPQTAPTTSGDGAERVLLCPKNGHALSSFTVPNRLYACDVCDCRPQRGSTMHGCRECDWDICENCLKQQYQSFSSAVVEPQTGEGPNSSTPPPKMTVVSPPSSSRPRMAFVKDLNLMDGSVVVAGTSFTKVWRVRNSSDSLTWLAGCRLVCVGGDLLGASPQGYLVPPLPPKEALDLVVKFVAPQKPGRYLSYWRLITPANKRFGQRLWLDVFVEKQTNPAPADKWAKQLKQLADMDFVNTGKNVVLLEEHNGEVEQVIAALLEEQKGAY